MQKITLTVPDEKFSFFLDLMEELGFEVAAPDEIPEAHQKIVLERIEKSKRNPQRLLEWEKIKDQFKVD